MQQGRPPLPPPPPAAPPPQPGAAPAARQQQQQPQQPQPQQPQQPAAGQPLRVDYETVFTNAKAGMEGVDPEHVKRVVYEASKDSPHYANEQRKDAAVEQKIARMQAAAAALSPVELAAHTASMDGRLAELEAGRDLTRTWLHVDMDAFFAAVEELDQPNLRGRPFAVGGIGMISTASYAARKFGVRSAMPGFIAVKLCPQLIFVRPDFEKYRRASEATRAVFRCYDPDFQPGSMDEASLDVTDYCAAHGVSGEVVAADIRRRVQEETHLTCSVGIAPNRMLAKICSDKNKPNGQFALEPTRDAVLAFMASLSIRNVPGVGKVTQKVLARFGMQTGADLLEHRGMLEALFAPISVDWFARVALGLGETRHPEPPGEGEVGRKGMSHERTFRPLSRRSELEGKLRELADALAADMAEEGGLRGKTVTLKLKLSTFELHTRATTLPTYVHTAEELYTVGLRLLRAEMPCELRLLGLRVSNFKGEGKREPGQRSIEEMLRPRQQAQQQQPGGQEQQAGGAAEPEAGSSGEGGSADEGGEEDGVHTSQVLSAGELLELSLRDWHPQPSEGRQEEQEDEEEALDLSLRDWQQPAAAGGSSGGQGVEAATAATAAGEGWPAGAYLSLPPSLAVSPASAARYEREATAAAAHTEAGSGDRGSGGPAVVRPAAGLPLHMPPTGLDVMLQQAAGKLARLEGAGGQQQQQGPQPPAEQQQQQQQQQAQSPAEQQQEVQVQQAAQQVWACSACTYENPKSAFWCEMCGSSRIPRREQPAQEATAAAAGGKTPAGGSKATGSGSKATGSGSKATGSGNKGSKAGGQTGSSSKGRRGRKPAALPPPGPSILRFMSSARQTSPPVEQQQQQQVAAATVRQAAPPVEGQQQQAAVAAARQDSPVGEQAQQAQQEQQHTAAAPNGEREASPDAQQAQQQGQEQAQQQQMDPAGQQQQQVDPAGQQQQQQVDPADQQQAALYEEQWDDDDEDWYPDGYEPESPPQRGEDILECRECLAWVKQTRYQAHEDMHLAQRLQQQEDKADALYARLTANIQNGGGSGRSGGGGSAPAGGSSKKRGTADKGGKGGGRQATLQAAFAKRAKQQQ